MMVSWARLDTMGNHQPMSRSSKVLTAILSGRSDASIRFRDLCAMLERLGFDSRVRGSHHVFEHPSVPEMINLQAVAGRAKRYQVRQVRRILIKHSMTVIPGGQRDD